VCGNELQEAKIVLGSKIIEQVSKFEYRHLRYVISNEIKKSYKIGDIRERNFGKQVLLEIKIRIHFINNKSNLLLRQWVLGI